MLSYEYEHTSSVLWKSLMISVNGWFLLFSADTWWDSSRISRPILSYVTNPWLKWFSRVSGVITNTLDTSTTEAEKSTEWKFTSSQFKAFLSIVYESKTLGSGPDLLAGTVLPVLVADSCCIETCLRSDSTVAGGRGFDWPTSEDSSWWCRYHLAWPQKAAFDGGLEIESG